MENSRTKKYCFLPLENVVFDNISKVGGGETMFGQLISI